MAFAHLHVHTEYSVLDGSNRIKDYVSKAKALGMTNAAITDHGVMYGVVEFYKQCKDAGINPVLGCEVYVSPGSRFDRNYAKGQEAYYHLILLAENNTGYANLMKLVSAGFTEGFYKKPRVDRELLEQYHEGIICLSACLAGEVARLLGRGLYEEAKEAALWHLKTFGQNNYFLEMQDHGIPLQGTVNQQLMRLSQETGIPLVCTNDVHYTYDTDVEAHDILLCAQTKTKLNDENRMRYEGGQYYLKSEEEMAALFPYAKDAIARTDEIASRCHVEIEFGVTKLPHYDTPEGYDGLSYLTKLTHDGLRERYQDYYDHDPEHYKKLEDQLDYELGVINNMGYVDYFLIVWDFINYARSINVPVGPGRGSAAGSLVSYTTGITDIDPDKYSLIFERFLNPERVSMPDVDIDFCPVRRGEVIDYVVNKYGQDCVTQIITFGCYKAKNAINEVGRVMDLPIPFVRAISKAVPADPGITIAQALAVNPELRKMYDEDDTVKQVVDMAQRIEGLPSNTGVHPAGVVIAQEPMDTYVPLAISSDGNRITQFEAGPIEQLGLLKMDFLALRNLTVIDNALAQIEAKEGKRPDFKELGYDDKGVFDLISTGNTEGIFQLESGGMKNFMKQLRPESLEDVIAGISLYRPGPMDFIPAYIKGKNDKSSITYDCPELEPILKPTYGCIVYQEQVMQIVRELAGYSMGQADNVRKAMSKKKDDVMQKERQNFVFGNPDLNIKGCIANGIPEAVAQKIYDDMIDFAKYAFNKSHAAAYAYVAYQTAYLKCYYPKEYMSALMTSVSGNTTKLALYIQVCRDMGIAVLPPDVNVGMGDFAVSDGDIRYGMYAVKGAGSQVVDRIIEERRANGPFTTLEDFITRVSANDVSKKVIESLIMAGALDCLEGNRRQKMSVYAEILDGIKNDKKHSVAGQMSLMDMLEGQAKAEFEIKLPPLAEYSKEDLLAFEKEILNIYVSGHPLDEYKDMLDKTVTAKSIQFMNSADGSEDELESDGNNLVDGSVQILGGMIAEVKTIFTKRNEIMARIVLEDLVGTVELLIWPRTYDKCREFLHEGEKILVKGKVQDDIDRDSILIVDRIMPFSQIGSDVWIQFEDMEQFQAREAELMEATAESEGPDGLLVYVKASKQIKRYPSSKNIKYDLSMAEKLGKLFGSDNVKVTQKKIEF